MVSYLELFWEIAALKKLIGPSEQSTNCFFLWETRKASCKLYPINRKLLRKYWGQNYKWKNQNAELHKIYFVLIIVYLTFLFTYHWFYLDSWIWFCYIIKFSFIYLSKLYKIQCHQRDRKKSLSGTNHVTELIIHAYILNMFLQGFAVYLLNPDIDLIHENLNLSNSGVHHMTTSGYIYCLHDNLNRQTIH